MATVTETEIEPLILHGVTYRQYVRLRKNPRNDHLRMTFFDGVLELMSPEYRHEFGARQIDLLIHAVASIFGIAYRGAASTTFRRGELRGEPGKGKGKEPDQSYYFSNAPAIHGHQTIDLEVDPPPDLWIEVDNRSSSRGRLPLYAALGVPEVWQYRVRRSTLKFWRLAGDHYEEIGQSLSLPMLTPAVVLERLAMAAQASDDIAWDREMRRWLNDVLKPRFETHRP
jgi:Uma2 family endonuclease